jgi:predicted dehydrogenase
MTPQGRLKVGLVGLRFGARFIPIYQHHPDVAELAVCDSDEGVLARESERFGVDRRTRDLAEMLAWSDLDAVHLTTPIPLHAEQSVAVLEAAKHCACTVPMATSIQDLRRIISAVRAGGRTYMMMETAVYTRGFLMAREMLRCGELGRIQLLKGAHYQDMESWPAYWKGLPPFHYGTHAVGPMLALAGQRAVSVRCLGSGVMREELVHKYGNPYPCETAVFRLEDGRTAAEATRTLFHTARDYTESFSVYGEKAGFEWQQLEKTEDPVVFRLGEVTGRSGRQITAERVSPPDRADLLPPEIARFTRPTPPEERNAHLSFFQGGEHHGSHPHMVHEFVRAVIEKRRPYSDEITAANWTAAGICAHISAMQDGAVVQIPSFAVE